MSGRQVHLGMRGSVQEHSRPRAMYVPESSGDRGVVHLSRRIRLSKERALLWKFGEARRRIRICVSEMPSLCVRFPAGGWRCLPGGHLNTLVFFISYNFTVDHKKSYRESKCCLIISSHLDHKMNDSFQFDRSVAYRAAPLPILVSVSPLPGVGLPCGRCAHDSPPVA